MKVVKPYPGPMLPTELISPTFCHKSRADFVHNISNDFIARAFCKIAPKYGAQLKTCGLIY
jgi:hypothetical protein